MRNINVIFMGTPSFSVPVLEELIKNTNVVMVVTAPDALVGRKRVLTPCPVKELALKNNIKVFSPIKLREDYEEIIKMNADIIITCAYGQIVPEDVLNAPKYGCINIHGSILPKYRGASPIHAALLNGDNETGISLMYMEKGLDTGDIIKIEKVLIDPLDNFESLSNKLSLLGSKMIIDELPRIIDGTNDRVKQNEEESSYVGLIKREDEHLDFNLDANKVFNKIRTFSPAPLANFIMDDVEYKIGAAEIVDAKGDISTIVDEDKDSFTIMCNDKGIKVLKIKPIGKNLMSVRDFKNGYHDKLIGKVVR